MIRKVILLVYQYDTYNIIIIDNIIIQNYEYKYNFHILFTSASNFFGLIKSIREMVVLFLFFFIMVYFTFSIRLRNLNISKHIGI